MRLNREKTKYLYVRLAMLGGVAKKVSIKTPAARASELAALLSLQTIEMAQKVANLVQAAGYPLERFLEPTYITYSSNTDNVSCSQNHSCQAYCKDTVTKQ
jgi:hypothetical protein